MKAKKILFTTSGILKLVASGFLVLVFGLSLLLGNVLKEAFLADFSMIEEIINELVALDPAFAYLQEMTQAEVVDFIMTPVSVICVFLFIMGVCGVVFGIFNLIFAKKYNEMLAGKTGSKVLFMIFNLLFYWGLATNVLTIVALFLKDAPKMQNSSNVQNISTTSEGQQ